MSRKRKSNSAVGRKAGGEEEDEEEESLGRKLLRWMESKEDVSFLAGPEGEQEEIKASSILLSALSPVFDVMFNENWKQQNQKIIELPDIKPHIFRNFIQLLLIDKVKSEDLCELKLSDEDILHMLYVAKKYETKSIASVCRTRIEDNITIENLLSIYATLQNMDEPELEQQALTFIKENIEDLMDDESFLNLSEENLMEILKFDDLSVSELTLFHGVSRWAETKCVLQNVEINGENIRAALGSVLFLLRFPVMTNRDFFKSVQPTGILSLEEINDIARCIALKGDSSFVSKFGFSSKERQNDGNVRELFTAVPNPDLQYCLMHKPTKQRTLNKVVVNSMESETNLDNSSRAAHEWSLKLIIFKGEREVLPMIRRSSSSTRGLSYTFPKPLTLKAGRSYVFEYEVKKTGSIPFYFLKVSGSTITITVQSTMSQMPENVRRVIGSRGVKW